MSILFNYKKIIQVFFIILLSCTVLLAYSLHEAFLLLTLTIGLLFTLFTLKCAQYKYQLLLKQRLDTWPAQPNKKRTPAFFTQLWPTTLSPESFFTLNKQTISDLNLEDIFERIDYTTSLPGQQYLYRMLTTPSLDVPTLKTRDQAINYLLEHDTFREDLFKLLYRLDDENSSYCIDFLLDPIVVPKKQYYQFVATKVLNIATLCSIFIYPPLGLTATFIMIVVSFKVYYTSKIILQGSIYSTSYLSKLLRVAGELNQHDLTPLGIDQSHFQELLEHSTTLQRHLKFVTALSDPTSPFHGFKELYQYASVLLMLEPISYCHSITYITKYLDEIKTIYETIGQVDALLSIASLRRDTPYLAIPEFNHETLSIDDAYYPLLDNPIANSIIVSPQKGVFITGSNMSGKSTFLRTIALNTLLAQTIVTTFASSYKARIYKIYTSISISDDLLLDTSLYLAEVKAIKAILDDLDSTLPTLCFIDEIFSGTNRVERTASSQEILKYLLRYNAIPFVSTHDLEIANTVANYDQYHFTEHVEDDDILFDYTLKEGISTSSNAIEVLKYAGYPDEIYKYSKTSAHLLRKSM